MDKKISPFTSIALDGMRFVLAISVAASHWTQSVFQTGWPDLTPLAVAAVGGFFVLSGFTIRTLTPPGERFVPSAFFVERISRLWSVMLPAAVLTVVLDCISSAVNVDFYDAHWTPGTYPGLRIVANLLFLNELWGRDVNLFSNTLFWSLGYEAGFYLIYGLFRAYRGPTRFLMVAAGCFLMGPNIVLMLAPWLLGLLAHDRLAKLQPGARDRTLWAPLAAGLGVMILLAATVMYGRPLFMDGAMVIKRAIYAGFAPLDERLAPILFGIHVGPARIDGFLIVGAVWFTAFFVPLMILCQSLDARVDGSRSLVRWFRRLGDFTFPLYLLHFPMLVLLGALGFYDRHSSLEKVLLFLAVCISIYGFTPVANSFKRVLRRRLGEAVDWVLAGRAALPQGTLT
jgi:peptidoglycan/LPS O-acetylase OafA/YrhL